MADNSKANRANRTDQTNSTDNARPSGQDPLTKVQEYKDSVLAFEALDKQIDDLLQSAGGHTDKLSDEQYVHYRELASLRDLAYNRMKSLEQGLLDEN